MGLGAGAGVGRAQDRAHLALTLLVLLATGLVKLICQRGRRLPVAVVRIPGAEYLERVRAQRSGMSAFRLPIKYQSHTARVSHTSGSGSGPGRCPCPSKLSSESWLAIGPLSATEHHDSASDHPERDDHSAADSSPERDDHDAAASDAEGLSSSSSASLCEAEADDEWMKTAPASSPTLELSCGSTMVPPPPAAA